MSDESQEMDEERKLRLARAFTERLPAPEEIRDDWGRFIIETALPEGSGPDAGLNQRDRSLITIAALTARHMPHELKLHIARGRDNGLSPRRDRRADHAHGRSTRGFPGRGGGHGRRQGSLRRRGRMRIVRALIVTGVVLLSAVSVAARADIVDDLAKKPEIVSAKISPTGEYLAVLKEEEDKRVVAVFAFPDMQLINVVDFPGRSEVGEYDWVNDERLLFSIAVDWGNREDDVQYGELYAVNADGKKGKYLFGIRGGSATRAGTRVQKVQTEFAAAVLTGKIWGDPEHVLITTYQYGRGYKTATTAMWLNVYTGRQSQEVRAPRPNALLVADAAGQVRFSFHLDDEQVSIIHMRDLETGEWREFHKAAYGESQLQPITIREDGKVYVLRAPDDGPRGLYLFDPDTERYEALVQHDVVDVDRVLGRFDGVYGALLYPGEPMVEILDPEHPAAALYRDLRSAFPRAHGLVSDGSRDQRFAIVRLLEDTRSPEYYLHDAQSKTLRLLFDARPWIDDTALPEMRAISVTARDGLELHGYLTLPKGAPARDLPLVIVPHGGPHGPRDRWGFNWESFIPASGYALLQVNYRGSGGYGQAFERAGYGHWATKMQDDLTDAVRWAIEEGIADPDRVCISGWSYGGYASAMSIVREPDLYRCAIAGAGVYDQEIQYDKSDFADYTRWGRRYMDKVIGATAEARLAASPIAYVDKIDTPLLLIHGGDDRRVPVDHAHALRKAMRAAGKPVPDLVLLKNEPHSPRNEENIRRWYRATIEFLAEHIGPGVLPTLEPQTASGR